MDLVERASYAMRGFMTGNPERVPSGHRVFFGLVPFPVPKAEHMQWDDGDGTSRALDAWLFVRRMTGDREAGREVEEGQWRYLQSLLNPETGLVSVGDLSRPHAEGYFYHLWDQGRTLRHLVNRYLDQSTGEKSKTELLIVSMIAGLKRLGSRTTLEDGTDADYWQFEAYRDGTPIVKTKDYDFTYAFTIANGQLLEPACAWALVTGSEEDFRWTTRLAAGFLAGLETRRESTTPMFGPKGEFSGHFHCAMSSLVGLVHFVHLLIRRGETGLAKSYLDTAVRAYRWIFTEENRNRGGSHGWFPESSLKRQSNISEICCTADMIELASALAQMATMIEGYDDLDALWDDVDRFTRNELLHMQILNPDKLVRWLDPNTAESLEAFHAVSHRYLGGWSFGHTWPHDLMDFDKDRKPERNPDGSLKRFIRMPIGGCCSYSGPRGLYACWKAAVEIRPDEVEIRFPTDYSTDAITVTEIPSGGLSYHAKRRCKVFVRVPENVQRETVQVLGDGRAIAAATDHKLRRMVIESEPRAEYSVSWHNQEWESRETLGPANDGHLPGRPIGSRVTYALGYSGNTLKEIIPHEAALLPYKHGL